MSIASQKNLLIALAVVVALAAAGGYAVYDFWKQQQSTPVDIVIYGNVDIREAELAFNVVGRIESMLVEEGDVVKNGQLIATLESDIYQAEVDAAKARVGAQRAVLDRLLSGSRPEEIKKARANVQAIEANLEDAQASLQRSERLAKANVATLQKLDDDRARVSHLKAQINAAQQELSLTIQGPRDEDIAESRARLRAGEAELTIALWRLDYTKLLTKSHGVIKTRIVEPGAVVLAHTPVYTITLPDPIWVRTYVTEPNLGRVYPGMKASIVTDSARGKPYHGHISFISPVAEFTPKTVETTDLRTDLVYRLRVIIDDPDLGLRQGMPVTVTLRRNMREE